MSNKKTVVFLDRDGVINNNQKGFVNKPEEFEFVFGSPYAIKSLNDAGIMTIIVTNQGGIEKGYYTEEDFLQVQNYMEEQLKKFKAKVDHTYYCKFLDSYYRKPFPGMITGAIKELKLDNYNKYMVGDRITDIIAGNRANCKTILVKSGDGTKELQKIVSSDGLKYSNKIKSLESTPNHITANLKSAVKWILNNEHEV